MVLSNGSLGYYIECFRLRMLTGYMRNQRLGHMWKHFNSTGNGSSGDVAECIGETIKRHLHHRLPRFYLPARGLFGHARCVAKWIRVLYHISGNLDIQYVTWDFPFHRNSMLHHGIDAMRTSIAIPPCWKRMHWNRQMLCPDRTRSIPEDLGSWVWVHVQTVKTWWMCVERTRLASHKIKLVKTAAYRVSKIKGSKGASDMSPRTTKWGSTSSNGGKQWLLDAVRDQPFERCWLPLSYLILWQHHQMNTNKQSTLNRQIASWRQRSLHDIDALLWSCWRDLTTQSRVYVWLFFSRKDQTDDKICEIIETEMIETLQYFGFYKWTNY